MAAGAAEACFREGKDRLDAGDAAGAETCFRAALAQAPDFAAALGNLGFVLEDRGALAEAEACYRRCLELDPTPVQIHLNLGALLLAQQRFAEAEAVFLDAIRCDPQSPRVWSAVGVFLAGTKREEDAERCYRQALELDADYALASFNLAYLLLRQGRFEEGWRRLDARDWYGPLQARLGLPRWRGESLAGRRLLIADEIGHGDMIQFGRYGAELKARGAARIGLLCQPALTELLATLDGVDVVLPLDTEVDASAWDFWSPALSLPRWCETRLGTIPANLPYLQADPRRIVRWAADFPAAGLKVGLVWKGNPRFENDAERSLPSLEVLAPLGAVAGVQFVSLQKGAGEDEAANPPPGLPLLDLGSRMENFADTAAIMANLDLVITVDTAAAHLAGALGKPCWVLLPDYKTDWRWLTEREDSPWYPGVMRLFRQPTTGDWGPVVERMVEDLGRLRVG
ncbi:MAG: tetratricopeptide repeat protein [Sterolibacteriaceae bacterium MAG5]|nr:tetratricopeptide repeat protein [Candidatus Nitricoxidireducens bremensis]